MQELAITEQMHRLEEARKARQDSAYEQYRGLVKATADGREVDASAAAASLDDASKTVQDLQADAELLLRRRQWAGVVAKEAAAHQQAAECEAEIEKLRSAQAAVNEDFMRKLKEFDARRSAALGQQAAAVTAVDHLKRTAPPHLRERVLELREESRERFGIPLKGLANGIRHCEARIQTAKNNLAAAEAKAKNRAVDKTERDKFNGIIAEQTARLKELRAQHAALSAEREKYSEQIQEIEEAKLQP